ncbi:DUF1816 domain-containing protein [Crocosphaera sp. XPORK-15E]|uniref:DUF1816 domain-containing protein n=1 Tax=Crocosphaera sp. XPORK-15E TaxID=3110247 RepID=UPI002B2075C2|nr:DUF1816 domain-containing protein [Crocosphaera sp. XPORK-15E]MEA5535753.1 DUF1816 domain-containing protein [Crocosphaera sp. XPORK-15E]
MLKMLNFLGMAYWAEIITESPQCTYYFGPFSSKQEADEASTGYLEDLHNEGAQGVNVIVKRCKPSNLTVFDDMEDYKPFSQVPSLSH